MRRVASGVRSYVVRLYAAYESFNRDGGYHLAAAAAYFFGLSLFPMLSVRIMARSAGSSASGSVCRPGRPDPDPRPGRRPCLAGRREAVQQLMEQIQFRVVPGGLIGLAMLCLTVSPGRILAAPAGVRPDLEHSRPAEAGDLVLPQTGAPGTGGRLPDAHADGDTCACGVLLLDRLEHGAGGWAARLQVQTPASLLDDAAGPDLSGVNVLAFIARLPLALPRPGFSVAGCLPWGGHSWRPPGSWAGTPWPPS